MKLQSAFVVAALLLSGWAFVGCAESSKDTPETVASSDPGEPVDATDTSAAKDMAETAESDSAPDAEIPTGSTVRPWIDTHAHPRGIHTECSDVVCLDAVIAFMDEYGVKKSIQMHPPTKATGLNEEFEAMVRTVVEMRPDRFFLGVGGNVLNSRIQKAGDSEQEANLMEATFIATANELLADGEAVVFGETTSCHLSLEDGHAFEQAPTDSKLFRALIDVAASHDVAVDIHIDVAIETQDIQPFFKEHSNKNPDQIQANMADFEALLAHNRNARVVLAHVGRDTTGDMTAPLMEELLLANANLYLQIHPVHGPINSPTSIVDEAGDIRPEWLTLLETHSDRFVLGSDYFLSSLPGDTKTLLDVQNFLGKLSEELAYEIGCENPVTIYKLSSGCE